MIGESASNLLELAPLDVVAEDLPAAFVHERVVIEHDAVIRVEQPETILHDADGGVQPLIAGGQRLGHLLGETGRALAQRLQVRDQRGQQHRQQHDGATDEHRVPVAFQREAGTGMPADGEMLIDQREGRDRAPTAFRCTLGPGGSGR